MRSFEAASRSAAVISSFGIVVTNTARTGRERLLDSSLDRRCSLANLSPLLGVAVVHSATIDQCPDAWAMTSGASHLVAPTFTACKPKQWSAMQKAGSRSSGRLADAENNDS